MANLHILSAGAAKAVVKAAPDLVVDDATVTIEGSFGPVGAIRERFVNGESCDLVILSRAVIDELAAAGHVVGHTTASIGRVPTGIAVRTHDDLPDIHDGDALRAALIAADGLYVADTRRSTAGAHFVRVLDQLGIRDLVGPRIHESTSGSVAMHELARAPGTVLGCTQVTEILEADDVRLVGSLPGEYALTTEYAGAVSSQAHSPEMALTFLRLLSGVRTRQARRDAGYEVD
jgi:molybdate transport system substrate-binding protein